LPPGLEKAEVPSFDEVMDKFNSLIIEVEAIRLKISKPWGYLLYYSGAIVLKNPTLFSAVWGLLFQAARDLGQEITKHIEIIHEKPFIKLKEGGAGGPSTAIQKTIDHFKEFFEAVVNLKDDAEKLVNDCEEIAKSVMDKVGQFTDEFTKKVEGDYMKLMPYLDKLNGNRKKIQRTCVLIKDVAEILGKAIPAVKNCIDRLKNPAELEVFKNIYDGRSKDENKSEIGLYFNFTKEEKLDKLEEYLDTWRKITEDAEELYNEAKEDLEKNSKRTTSCKKT